MSRLLALALLAAPAAAADDPYGDPLPAGAKVRLGTARLRGPHGEAQALLTADGKLFVGPAAGGAVGWTDAATGKVVRTVKAAGEFGAVVGVSADGARAVSAGSAAAVVWDTRTGKAVVKVARPLPPWGAVLSADGRRVAVGARKGYADKPRPLTAAVWDVDAGKEVAAVAPAQNEDVSVALSADGRRLATWGYHHHPAPGPPPDPETDPGRLVQFWDAGTGKETGRVRLTATTTRPVVALAPDGSVAAVSEGDGLVRLVDPATGAGKGELLGRSGQGLTLAFAPDGKALAAGGGDGSVQRWALPDGRRLGTTEAPVDVAGVAPGLRVTGPDRAVAWARVRTAAVAWEVPSGKLLSPPGGHTDPVVGAAFAAGGKEVLTTAGDGKVVRWDAATGRQLGAVELKDSGAVGERPRLTGPDALSADGTRALVYGGVYDLPAGVQQFVLPAVPARDVRAAFTPDGTKVVQVVDPFDPKAAPRVGVWDVAAARRLGGVELPGLAGVAATLTPDGKTLVTAGVRPGEKDRPGPLVVTGWDLGTGKKRGEYVAGTDGFGNVSVGAADNSTAVVTTPDSTLAVVDVVAGKKVRDLDVGNGELNAAPVVSPDGRVVAVAFRPTVGPDPPSPVLLVDVATGKVVRTLGGASGTVRVVAFSPDGKGLVTGSSDTTALVWDLTGK